MAAHSFVRSRARTVRERRGSARRVRLVADVGLALLPVLVVEVLTGVVLFLFAHGLTPKEAAWAGYVFNVLASANLLVIQDISFQTDVHVWAGYLTTWAILLKAWASWPTLTGWWPRKFSRLRRRFEKATAWSVLLLVPASYLSGIALALRLLPREERTVRDLHLWVSALLILPLAWHLVRFFPEGIRVLRVQINRATLTAGALRK